MRCVEIWLSDKITGIRIIVLVDNMRSAINMASEHGEADFQSRFGKSTAQAEQMKEGARRVLAACNHDILISWADKQHRWAHTYTVQV
jgi:hypothetical protein